VTYQEAKDFEKYDLTHKSNAERYYQGFVDHDMDDFGVWEPRAKDFDLLHNVMYSYRGNEKLDKKWCRP